MLYWNVERTAHQDPECSSPLWLMGVAPAKDALNAREDSMAMVETCWNTVCELETAFV